MAKLLWTQTSVYRLPKNGKIGVWAKNVFVVYCGSVYSYGGLLHMHHICINRKIGDDRM